MTAAKVRLLVGKIGLDGHDRGAKIIARALRDAGFEIVYTGLHQTPEVVAAMEAATARKIRVVVAKPGLDGHDRGAKIIARALRDAGMEVIYTGIRQTPEMIAEAALQEDVDVVGLSILSGAHLELFPRVVEELRKRGITPDDVLLFGGGIMPEDDIAELHKLGVSKVFTPGATTQEIIAWVRENVAPRALD